jgi:site-specific DNA-methyltransferase (adenine-specific)
MPLYYEDDSVTLWNGDCRDIAVPACDLVVTDPPYEIEDMSRYFGIMTAAMRPSASFYCFGDKRMIAGSWYRQFPLPDKDILAWYYNNSPKPRGRWRMSMQLIIYGYRGGEGSFFDEDAARIPYSRGAEKNRGKPRASLGRYSNKTNYADDPGALPRDVIECPALVARLSSERVGHPDQKPLALVKKLVLASSRPGDVVIDPFAGSGTTLVAAKQTGRKAWGAEIEEKNCEMIASRLEQMNRDSGSVNAIEASF